MGDDLANRWGHQFTLVSFGERIGNKRKATDVEESFDTDIGRNYIKSNLCDEFVFQKITPNGSDANLFAVTALTSGNTERCLIACGSYVSGDRGALQSWSTSSFEIENGPCNITAPDDKDLSQFTKCHTVALSYAIPGCYKDDNQAIHNEDLCLKHLHTRCLFQKILHRPINAFMMELILAGNGASLSNRFLIKLAKLAELHDINIIVDEIMTGGRVPTLLATLSKPKEFRKMVSYITIGKWTKCGVVFTSVAQDNKMRQLYASLGNRGTTTEICGVEAFKEIKFVIENLHNIPERCKVVLKKLKIQEKDSWGEGLLIFGPRRRSGFAYGTKNRFLPMIINAPIDSIRTTYENGWTKDKVHNNIVQQWNEWLGNHYILNEDDTKLHDLIQGLWEKCPAGAYLSTEFIQQTILKSSLDQKKQQQFCANWKWWAYYPTL